MKAALGAEGTKYKKDSIVVAGDISSNMMILEARVEGSFAEVRAAIGRLRANAACMEFV